MTPSVPDPTSHRGLAHRLARAGAAIAVALTVLAALLSAQPAEAASSTITWTKAKVIRWIDGDTVVTDRGTVRLIGVDTPEKGRCGASTATRRAKKWAPAGSTVRLGDPASVMNRDGYGRSLRYVVRGKVDVSRYQIARGAKARYDSRDGYQWHPRQTRYRATDKANKDYTCKSASSGEKAKPSGRNCPKSAPIKGNESSMIYHLPGQRYYKVTIPEECFKTEKAARAAGYRKAKV